jgi:glyoxylase-like metal-dependent hydrolase (beta-lactamase superfamily II)
MSQETYEVYAVKYATREGTRSANFIGGDLHDAPMPMDYFVWLIRNDERTFVVDTGFSAAMARQRKRTFLRSPSDGLALQSRLRSRRCGGHGEAGLQGSRSLSQRIGRARAGRERDHIGGHTAGLQCVRVATARGWVVLASDTSHYYEHMETGRVFPTAFHVGEMMEGYDRLRALAGSPKHIIPGHDPLVMERYPAPSKGLEGIAARLDMPPVS